jgi:threonine dehydrogenase-like Zn-dependent dehydrogenase
MARQIVFTAPQVVELQQVDFQCSALGASDVAIRTHYSLISPGTELACLRGTESWAPLPFAPGYAAVGEVLAVGREVSDWAPGDVVFTYSRHASPTLARTLVARVPAGLDLRRVCFARLAAVAMTALRVSDAELGDRVAVIGLGLVGNLAAQLFRLAGCEVIGIDLSEKRCQVAASCGVRQVIAAPLTAAIEQVRDLTAGDMCQTVVEATGLPAVACRAPELAGKLGEVVFLGSPRGDYAANVTDLLNRVHLWGNGCVTLKGAHEWRYPVRRDPAGQSKHSIERNVEIVLGLIAEGRLIVDPLLTHVLPPHECSHAYAGLRERPDEFLGVLFDWTA